MVLATKLSTDAFVEFLSCGLPKDVTDYSYEEAVERYRLLFSKQRSVFADRYDCMRLTRDEGEEFMHLVIRCKAALLWFKFEELTKNNSTNSFSCPHWNRRQTNLCALESCRSLTMMVIKCVSTT